jgi:hypothetical protein
MVFFSKGDLVRGFALDTSKAMEMLCAQLRNEELSEPDWFVRFGSEKRRPSCPQFAD